MGRRRIVTRAYAKLNLDLRVLGRRADGLHELRTIYQSIELADCLTVTVRPGPFELRCSDPAVPVDRRNLAWAAVVRASRAVGRGTPRDLSVFIDKRIPVEAGLGGGSADAAAMLHALTRLWPGELSASVCRRIASRIGSDVPFFLVGGTVLGLGAGDELFPLVDLPTHWEVVLIPTFGVPTASAYGWFDLAPRRVRPVLSREPLAVRAGALSLVGKLVNDLEPAVTAKYPEVRRMKAALRRAGADHPSMSGSGSCVFGLFSRRRDATAAAGVLRRHAWRVIVARTLSREDIISRESGCPRGAG